MLPEYSDELLWFYESDRMWEDFSEPEGMSKPQMVKVILVVQPGQIDFV